MKLAAHDMLINTNKQPLDSSHSRSSGIVVNQKICNNSRIKYSRSCW